ncbi:MAG: helix-turn-helix domain-containing protein [Myxococcales bacterium]
MSKAPLLDGVDLTVPCTGSKMCPISSSPCPGLCIFADILASISLGIVVFDLESRPEDIPALARHLLSGICKRHEPAEIDDAELARLGSYPWPGNVRELRNVLERAVLLQRGRLRPWELIQDSPLPSQFPARPASADLADPTKPLLLAEVERLHIGKALRGTGGNLTLAARVLGISLSTLKRRVKQTGSF